RIESTESDYHSFITVTDELALDTAKAVDAKRSAGEDVHALAGVPVALKDLVVTEGVRTTAGSKMLENWVPPYESTVHSKVRAAGLPVLGKTNLDEFAMGSTTEHSAFGDTRNPWNLDHVPGGSSGGAAAALAGFQTPLSVGTDTGGSVRQPAAFTGTVGVKPTYGSISRFGIIAMASSLDRKSTRLNSSHVSISYAVFCCRLPPRSTLLPTRRSSDLDHVPGGSSGGAAAALAGFQTPLSVGTDTGGSVRQPAAFTGTVGVKPTYGSISRFGIIAMASSLDQVGPMGRSVADAAALHELLAGHDPLDSTSLPDPVAGFLSAAQTSE